MSSLIQVLYIQKPYLSGFENTNNMPELLGRLEILESPFCLAFKERATFRVKECDEKEAFTQSLSLSIVKMELFW